MNSYSPEKSLLKNGSKFQFSLNANTTYLGMPDLMTLATSTTQTSALHKKSLELRQELLLSSNLIAC
jgi:hypothetical protein